MKTRNHRIPLSAAALVVAAGLASATLGQDVNDSRQPEWRTQEHERDARSAGVWRFHKASTILGAEVHNAADESIATIDDLIFEPGSGRLTHAVLSSGGALGIGAKKVAVPYDDLRFDAANDVFGSDMTEEQLDAAPEFKAEDWASLNHTTWMDDLRRTFRDDDEPEDFRDADADPYADAVRGAEPERVEGTVESVDSRSGEASGEEETVLTIRTDDGQTKKVVLGPSWYVKRQEATPYRDQRVSLEVYPIAGDTGADCVCGKVMDDAESLTLRDEAGSPAWRSGERAGAGRLMLMSDLVGAEALLPADDDTGEIQDVVVETESGRIVLASLDPNDNFLGVGDDLKGVPWPSVRVVDSDTVRIDGTAAMIENAEEIPDDVTVLATPEALRPAYEIFHVEIVPLEARRTTWQDQGLDGARPDAASQGEAVAALQRGEDVTITGEVTNVTTMHMQGFSSEMTVATIETEDGIKTVVLGPSSHFEGNPLMLSAGDRVTIEAKQANVRGRDLVAACTVDANGQETALWSGGRPIWE